ncbi:MAG: ABC transporter ATP-binding protein [Thermodesulfobacteriota bacterium]
MTLDSTPLLVVQNLTKRFGGLTAVDKVSLSFYPGGVQSIIGPNGAGKTTFFNLLSGLFPPTAGRVFFKGEEITRLTPYEIFRRRIVRTFQISSIFPDLSVLKNVQIAAQGRFRTSPGPWGRLNRRRQEITGWCLEYMARLNLLDKKDQKAGLLAYGDKRRLEIAMGLVCEPEMLLLDEPTAGMSPAETRETAQLLKSLAAGLTIILVEHDMRVVMGISDRVIVLHQGAVLCDGGPREVQENQEVQSVYLSGRKK